MSVTGKARDLLGDATAERLGGGKPGVARAAAGAAVAGGLTAALVYRLLRAAAKD